MHAQVVSDLGVGLAVGGGQHDPGPLNAAQRCLTGAG